MALVQTSMCSRGILTGQSIAKLQDNLGIWDRKSHPRHSLAGTRQVLDPCLGEDASPCQTGASCRCIETTAGCLDTLLFFFSGQQPILSRTCVR